MGDVFLVERALEEQYDEEETRSLFTKKLPKSVCFNASWTKFFQHQVRSVTEGLDEGMIPGEMGKAMKHMELIDDAF